MKKLSEAERMIFYAAKNYLLCYKGELVFAPKEVYMALALGATT